MLTPTAVVIGSGVGGLAAAIRLRKKGYAVTVLERLEQPGGRACVIRDGGYTFDMGPTIITAPSLESPRAARAAATGCHWRWG